MPLFTPEVARMNAAKSAEVRRANAQAKRNGITPLASTDAAYLRKRLARVRLQIEDMNKRLDAEQDPQAVQWIVNSIYRLTELERVIAGRPLPGQLKPVAARPARPSAEPLR